MEDFLDLKFLGFDPKIMKHALIKANTLQNETPWRDLYLMGFEHLNNKAILIKKIISITKYMVGSLRKQA